jgi:hypothetical protein
MKGNGHLLSILKGNYVNMKKKSIIIEPLPRNRNHFIYQKGNNSNKKHNFRIKPGIKTNAFRILNHGNRKRNENGNGTERNVPII